MRISDWSSDVCSSDLFNFKVIVQEMIDANLPSPRLFAIATMATQLTGSALVITNFAGLGWIGAFGLAVFLLLTIPIGHPFWKFEEPKRTGEFHIALEHITVVGGLMLAAILSTLPLPLYAKLEHFMTREKWPRGRPKD